MENNLIEFDENKFENVKFSKENIQSLIGLIKETNYKEKFSDKSFLSNFAKFMRKYYDDKDGRKFFTDLCQSRGNLILSEYELLYNECNIGNYDVTTFFDLIRTCINTSSDIKDYNKIINKYNIKFLINSIKDKFPKNELIQDDFNTKIFNSQYEILLKDKYCQIAKKEHLESNNYLILNKHGEICLRCNNDSCKNCFYPDPQIQLNINHISVIFNNNINNIKVINNCSSDDLKINIYDYISNIKIFSNNNINNLFLKSINDYDTYITDFIFNLCNDKFKYINNVWYKFNNKWVINNTLYFYIMSNIVPYYNDFISLIENNNIEKLDIILLKINFVIDKLKNKNERQSIVNEFKLLSESENNLNILDSNFTNIGFENGIYEIKTNLFKVNEPEYMISMSVGYNYTSQYSENKNDLLDFLNGILPDPIVKDYFLTYLSTALIGGDDHKLFTILIGKGKNGKKQLMQLIKLTFGDYFCGMELSELKSKEDLYKLHKKRIVIFNKNDGNTDKQFIKYFVENKELELNNDNKIKFTTRFIPFLMTNNINGINTINSCITNKLRYIHFPSEFVDDPKFLNQKQKVDEKILNDKFKLWTGDFMLLLLEYYQSYIDEGLYETDVILKCPIEIDDETGILIKEFLTKCTESSNKNIPSKILHKAFEKWYEDIYGNSISISNKNFVSEVRKYYTYTNAIRYENKTNTGFSKIKLNY